MEIVEIYQIGERTFFVRDNDGTLYQGTCTEDLESFLKNVDAIYSYGLSDENYTTLSKEYRNVFIVEGY